MNQSMKTVTLIVGTLLGAFLGYRTARSFIDVADESSGKLPITASQGLQVGLTAVNALKQISKISHTRS